MILSILEKGDIIDDHATQGALGEIRQLAC
jgi:hypothetical protein